MTIDQNNDYALTLTIPERITFIEKRLDAVLDKNYQWQEEKRSMKGKISQMSD